MSGAIITGAGLQAGLGNLAETWTRLCRGESAVRPLADDHKGYPGILGAPAAEFDPYRYLPDRKLQKYMNRTTALAVAAAGMALEDAGLTDDSARHDMALFMSTGSIAFDLSQVAPALEAGIADDGSLSLDRLGERGLALCNPMMPFKMLLNTPIGMVSIIHGIHGENSILYPGADQGAVALESAVMGILDGRFERALVGGAIQGLGLLGAAALYRSGKAALDRSGKAVPDQSGRAAPDQSGRAVPDQSGRAVPDQSGRAAPDRSGRAAPPSSAGQRGWAPCDAAAFLVLESRRSAAARGALPKARIEDVTIHGGHYRNPDDLSRFLREGAGGHPPDAIIATGALSETDDILLRRACAGAWPTAAPPMVSLDGHLGYAAAAAIPCLAAIAARWVEKGQAARWVEKGQAPRWTGIEAPEDLMICSRAPEECLVSARIGRYELSHIGRYKSSRIGRYKSSHIGRYKS